MRQVPSPTPAEAPATPQPEEQFAEFEEATPAQSDSTVKEFSESSYAEKDNKKSMYSITIAETVKKAIKNKGNLEEKYNQKKISAVPEDVAKMVYKASGEAIDISNKTIAINGSDVYHEYSRHSDEETERQRGQISLTEATISEAIESIYEPDIVECLFENPDNPTQRQSFAYAKKKDGYYVVAEAVGGKSNPNIVPVMMLRITEAKWDKYIGAGKTIGEMIFENDPQKLLALNIPQIKKNRVIAAQFVSNETIANTPHSPRSENSISHNMPQSQPPKSTIPTVSRDGIEIKPETDPEVQSRIATAKDELERTGILSGASDTTINTVRRLSKLLKTDIRFEVVSQIAGNDGETYDQNGRYDHDDGIIYINMGSGTDTYTQIIAHEFTHSVEGTKLYTMLEKYARKFHNGKAGKGAFDAEARAILARYQAANKDYDIGRSQAEVVSNYVANELLDNEANIERLVKENRTLAEKLKDVVDKVLSVIGKDNTKKEAQTKVKLTRMSKLLGDALKARDFRTNKTSDIKSRYKELRRKILSEEISDEDYEAELDELDNEAMAMGIDLQELMKGGESYSISETTFSDTYVKTLLSSFNINNVNIKDYIYVQRNVMHALEKENFFTNLEKRNRIDVNEKTGLIIETNKSGIYETFNEHNFKRLELGRNMLSLQPYGVCLKLLETEKLLQIMFQIIIPKRMIIKNLLIFNIQ